MERLHDSSGPSLSGYTLNVVNGCTVLLRHIEATGADAPTSLPREGRFPDEARHRRSQPVPTVEDAYVSYSDGYER